MRIAEVQSRKGTESGQGTLLLRAASIFNNSVTTLPLVPQNFLHRWKETLSMLELVFGGWSGLLGTSETQLRQTLGNGHWARLYSLQDGYKSSFSLQGCLYF